MTSSYSRSTSAAATHSGRPCSTPMVASRSASIPCSTARMSRSRALGAEASLTEGHEDVLRPGRLRSLTAGVTVEQLAEDDVLFWTADQPRRVITAEGRLAAQDAEPERPMSTGQRFGRRTGQPRGHALAKPGGGHPRRGEQEALVGVRPPWDAVDDQFDRGHGLAGAGAPRTRTTGARVSSTVRCSSSRLGASTTRAGARRRRTTSSSHHARATPPRQRAGPSHRALARSTRSPSSVPRIIGVFSSR